jgi:pyruvate dehydrogenase (quinone)
LRVPLPATTPGAASAADLVAVADLVNQAETVAIGRRAPLELGVVGDVAATLRALAPMVEDKHGDQFLREHVRQAEHARRRLRHYVTKGPGLKPSWPEYVAAVLSELADDDAVR